MSTSSSRFLPKNGPPDAVKSILFTSRLSLQPWSDWNIALCSLSTGSIATPFSFAKSITIWPPVTSVSLFARAIFFFAFIASIVGSSPEIPTTAVTTVSSPSAVAVSIRPSFPCTTFISVSASLIFKSLAFSSSVRHTVFGLNSLACFSIKSIFECADIASIFIPLYSRAISRVCVPIEPVEPNTAIFFSNSICLFSN